MALATEAVMTGLTILSALERKMLWPATWMIHNANHLRDNGDGLKIGGHHVHRPPWRPS
jgi:pyruvate dehydrogenase E1 component